MKSRFHTLRHHRFDPRMLASISVLAFAVAAQANEQSAKLPNSVRHADLGSATVTPVSGSEPVFFAISLQPRDVAGLERFVEGVSNPASPNYRQFLTPQQVGQLYGPSQADVNATVNFLKASGLKVDEVAANGFVVTAGGTAQQVQQAFKTTLSHVSTVDDNGKPREFRTNTTSLQMPASLASKVVSIDGIDTSIRRRPNQTTTQLNPTLERTTYGVSTGYAAGYYGQGVNIAIANWDGYRLDNVPYWTSAYSLPVPSGGSGSNIKIREVGTGTTYGSGTPEGEGDLDMQAVLQASPLANITIYDDATSDTAAPITTLTDISSDNTADVVTESYGWETSDRNTYYGSTWTSAHNLHLSIAAQGITYMAATGDTGTSNFPSRGARYGYPDIDPVVLAVGGSVATVNSSTGVRSTETSWGLSGGYGGTGGFDPYDTSAHGFAFNVAPSYETTYISSKTSKYNYRLLPDVVSFAGGQNGLGSNSGTGWAFAIYYNDGSSYPLGTSILIDGTSIASPTTAGDIGATLNHLFSGVTPNSSRSNVRLGEIQPFLYSVGTSTSVFYDITSGTSVGNLPGTSTAASPAAGWDYATGWGALNYLGLYNALVADGK